MSAHDIHSDDKRTAYNQLNSLSSGDTVTLRDDTVLTVRDTVRDDDAFTVWTLSRTDNRLVIDHIVGCVHHEIRTSDNREIGTEHVGIEAADIDSIKSQDGDYDGFVPGTEVSM